MSPFNHTSESGSDRRSSPSGRHPEPGEVLAKRYKIISLLGRGGMGSVWRAEHLTLGSHVALKLVDPDLAQDTVVRARFLREARAAAKLTSQHVVRTLDYGVDEDRPFIALELLEGETLAERLDRVGVLTVDECIRILSCVAKALHEAHRVGIVHRDLKPENIFLAQQDDEEIPKVLDFGVARLNEQVDSKVSHMTRTGAVLGTPDYMSPEQIENQGLVDQRTDIWAFAVIAFECLLGRLPFKSESVGSVFVAICARPIPVPSEVGDVPKCFDDWFARGTARNLEERFTTILEAANELSLACAGEETSHSGNRFSVVKITGNTNHGAPTLNVPCIGSTEAQERMAQLKARAQTRPDSPVALAPPAVKAGPRRLRSFYFFGVVACAVLVLLLIVFLSFSDKSATVAGDSIDSNPVDAGDSSEKIDTRAPLEPRPKSEQNRRIDNSTVDSASAGTLGGKAKEPKPEEAAVALPQLPPKTIAKKVNGFGATEHSPTKKVVAPGSSVKPGQSSTSLGKGKGKGKPQLPKPILETDFDLGL